MMRRGGRGIGRRENEGGSNFGVMEIPIIV
jgi:hypothetical protein